MTQIISQGLSDGRHHGKHELNTRLGSHNAHCHCMPVEVVQHQMDHLTCSQPVGAHQQQQGIVAFTAAASAIDGRQQSSDIRPCKRSMWPLQRPYGRTHDGGGQIGFYTPRTVEKSKVCPDGRTNPRNCFTGKVFTTANYEGVNLSQAKCLYRDAGLAKKLIEQSDVIKKKCEAFGQGYLVLRADTRRTPQAMAKQVGRSV